MIRPIILYIILIAIVLITKPQILYYDKNKTKLKHWSVYKHTQNPNDLCNIYVVSVTIAVMCVFICKFAN